MIATCNLCVLQGREPFRVPWDRIGEALMRDHIRADHPEQQQKESRDH